tara:strand:+ start:106 stop:345 length:240 start_codon:yes stop_codon:yes gene_type:complete
MQTEVSVPWPDDLDEFIFPSKTSLVNQKKTLVREMVNAGLLDSEMSGHKDAGGKDHGKDKKKSEAKELKSKAEPAKEIK